MSADRRLSKLEGSLPPQAAVLLWLTAVHEHGPLDAYVAWLLDQPASKAPSIVIIDRVRAAARAAHAGEPRAEVRDAERRATADAVFLLELVDELEHVAVDTIRTGSLRLAALHWELRARTAEGDTGREADPRGWAAWRAGVLDLATELARTEVARRIVEARYLAGREVLSPAASTAWTQLREGMDSLVATVPTPSGSRRGRRADGHAIRKAAERTAPDEARVLVARVRARTIDVLGDHAGAVAIVEGVLRAGV